MLYWPVPRVPLQGYQDGVCKGNANTFKMTEKVHMETMEWKADSLTGFKHVYKIRRRAHVPNYFDSDFAKFKGDTTNIIVTVG